MPQQIRMGFSNSNSPRPIRISNVIQPRQNMMTSNNFKKIGYGNMNSIFYSKGSSCG
jgi:hypothetical protein